MVYVFPEFPTRELAFRSGIYEVGSSYFSGDSAMSLRRFANCCCVLSIIHWGGGLVGVRLDPLTKNR